MNAFSRTFKILIILWLLVPSFGKAQKNHVIKLGVSKLLNEQVFIAHEFKVYQGFSIHYDIGVLFKAHYLETYDLRYEVGEILTNKSRSSENFRRRSRTDKGYQFTLEARYRPAKALEEGLFIGLRTSYQIADFGRLEVQFYDEVFDAPKYIKELNPLQQTWTIGSTIGFNLKVTSGLIAEFSIYSGYWYAELIDPEELEFVPFSDPAQQRFRNNHRVPVDRFQVGMEILVGF